MSCCPGHSLNSLIEWVRSLLSCARLQLAVAVHLITWGGFGKPFFSWVGLVRFLYLMCKKCLSFDFINNLVLLTCTTLLLKKLECVRIELVLWLFKTKNIYLSSVFCFVMMGALFREVLNQLTCFSRSGFHHMMVVFYEGITLNLKLITDFWI